MFAGPGDCAGDEVDVAGAVGAGRIGNVVSAGAIIHIAAATIGADFPVEINNGIPAGGNGDKV